MIIEFEPNRVSMSCPPKWWLYYKTENEKHFNRISVTYEQLQLFLETYGYETDDILALKKFGIDTKDIKQNIDLKWKV